MIGKCHAGCTIDAIAGALHLGGAQLFYANGKGHTNGNGGTRHIVATYDYTDAAGSLLYQSVRYEPKDFRCRRPDGAGGWTWTLDGVRLVPYRLLELAEAPRVYIPEGEKDADTLAALGLTATTNHGGAGKWRAEHTAALVAAAVPEVVVIRDNNRPGEAHAVAVARDCLAAGLRVRRVNLPGPLTDKHGADVSEWVAAGHTAAELEALADAAPILTADIDGAADDAAPIVSAESTPYIFASVVGAGHFLADYIAYAASRTDAAHELHEAAGLVLLAAATPNVRAMLAPYPGGLGTNLNVGIIGDSTLTRKSTARAIAEDLHDAVIAGGRLAELTSPEAFIEQLAQRPADSTTWFVDEMSDLLEKLHHAKHMAGLRGILLTVYDGRDYRYTRHSKRSKHGEKVEDEDAIRAPHLSVLGATTPAVFEILTSADVRSGLLPRFAIVMPQSKPDWLPFYGVEGWSEARRDPLAATLHRLYVWASSTPRRATFAPGALQHLDAFAAALEVEAAALDEHTRPMLHRLAPMALKVAMLLAAGRPTTPDHEALTVQLADAEVTARWRTDALAFAARIGESQFERTVARCRRVFQRKARPGQGIARRLIAQLVHVSKRTLDDVEATLQDRGEIHVARIETPGRPTLTLWEVPGATRL